MFVSQEVWHSKHRQAAINSSSFLNGSSAPTESKNIFILFGYLSQGDVSARVGGQRRGNAERWAAVAELKCLQVEWLHMCSAVWCRLRITWKSKQVKECFLVFCNDSLRGRFFLMICFYITCIIFIIIYRKTCGETCLHLLFFVSECISHLD